VTVTGGTASTATTTLPVGTDSLTAAFTPSGGLQLRRLDQLAGLLHDQSHHGDHHHPERPDTGEPAELRDHRHAERHGHPVHRHRHGPVRRRGTDIGSPVAVSVGAASTTTTALPVGTDSITAAFTPASASGFGPSSGSPVSYTINPIDHHHDAEHSDSGRPAVRRDVVSLSATVTPSTASGTVQFEVGGVAIGGPVAVSGGTASATTSALPVGSDSISRGLHAVNGLELRPSTSSPVSYTVNPLTPTSTELTVSPSGPQPSGPW